MAAFKETAPDFHDFLMSMVNQSDFGFGTDAHGGVGEPGNKRFIPRNFVMEEHLDSLRVDSYAEHLPRGGPADFGEWNLWHNRYLERHVFLNPPVMHDYQAVKRDDPLVCPETFRSSLAVFPFLETDLQTYLIRLVPAADIAWLLEGKESRENEEYIYSLGESIVADRRETNPAWQELSFLLEEAYTGPRCQHRPVFAAFYEDFIDDLNDPANTGWPNKLRDRMGLYHINQWQTGGLPRRVFLFRYAVKELPRFRGEGDRRPMAVPAVIDHRLCEVFCPTPREMDRGRVVDFTNGSGEEPVREILHLFMVPSVGQLFRVGEVTTPVPEDLGSARCNHLEWLRQLTDRADYGSITDRDLL